MSSAGSRVVAHPANRAAPRVMPRKANVLAVMRGPFLIVVDAIVRHFGADRAEKFPGSRFPVAKGGHKAI